MRPAHSTYVRFMVEARLAAAKSGSLPNGFVSNRTWVPVRELIVPLGA